MAANFDTEIYELRQAINYVGRSIDYQKETNAPSILNTGFGLYRQYFKLNKHPDFPLNPKVTDYDSFRRLVSPNDLSIIIFFFEKLSEPEEPKRQKAPIQEDSTIPADLEGLVAQYKENQADKILSADKPDSVEAAVKRARQTWETRHRIEILQKNRQEYKKQSDQFFANYIDPKTGDRETSFRQTEYVVYKVIQAKAAKLEINLSDQEIRQAIDDVTYLVTAGAFDVDNLYDLNIASELAFRNLEGKDFPSPLSKIDVENIYSDDPKIDEDLAENYYRTSTKILTKKLHDEDLDFDDKIIAAKKKLSDIQHNLETVI